MKKKISYEFFLKESSIRSSLSVGLQIQTVRSPLIIKHPDAYWNALQSAVLLIKNAWDSDTSSVCNPMRFPSLCCGLYFQQSIFMILLIFPSNKQRPIWQ